jgi:ABC-type dipeptide/oligopeptide/nickel transport system ATPase subunit
MNAHARSFEVKDAVRESVPVLVGLMGPSGGGKTVSALRLATGMQEITGGDIYGIDTEARRMLHHADAFKFKHLEFNAPFGSLDYLAALRHCVGKGGKIIIVDSMSHEHEGSGGMLDLHEQELDRLGGSDWAKRERVKMLAWQKPKAARRELINGLLQLNANFIFCFRAKNTVKPMKVNGKTEIVPQGFMPIAGDEFVFEMTVNCLLMPGAKGVPTWQTENVGERMMIKPARQFNGIFAEQKPLDESIGRALATWARGETPAQSSAVTSVASAPASGGQPQAGAADEQIPSAAEYIEQWRGIMNAATDATQLAATWNGQKALRNKIVWQDDADRLALQAKVTTAINSMRAPA